MTRRLPVVKAKDVVGALERAGFVPARVAGSHCRLIHAGDPARKTTVPLHSGNLPRGTLRDIIKQAGLTVEDFIALL